MVEFFKFSKKINRKKVSSFLNRKRIEPAPVLRGEHLKDSYKPIMTAILSKNHLGDSEKIIDEIINTGEFVDYETIPEINNSYNMFNPERWTYVISDCNEKPKFSERYCNCTGIVAVGTSKKNKKNISFLTHQDPWKFLPDEQYHNSFKDDLLQRIKKLQDMSEEGSIDVVVYGGHYIRPKEYKKSIETLNDICTNAFGFDPVIITGPNLRMRYRDDATNVYFDTENRRLFLVRPEQTEYNSNDSYTYPNLEKIKENWK